MVEALRSKSSVEAPGVQSTPENDVEVPVPPLTQAVGEKDGWVTVEKPSLFVYAGQGPYVSRYATVPDINCAVLTF